MKRRALGLSVLSLRLRGGSGVTLDGMGLGGLTSLCSLSPSTNPLKGKEIHFFPLDAAKGKMFFLLPLHHYFIAQEKWRRGGHLSIVVQE